MRILIIIATVLLVTASMGAGCASGPAPETVGDPVVPPAAELADPEAAVRSYLDWTSLAFRMANSTLSTHTHTPYQEVRVDSYIELNRQQGRGIEQRLSAFTAGLASSVEGTALVAASETWRYRYFSLATLEYVSPVHTASYEVTYTVLRQPDGRWLVDSVDARALGEVP